MTDQIRRVVTTHDERGRAIILSDQMTDLPAMLGADIKSAVVWTTGAVPANNLDDLAGEKRAAGMSLKGGSVLRATEFGPGFATPLHRTHSIDYAVLLSGELEMELDSGAAIRLLPGDVVVQRGTRHVWRNPSPTAACRIVIGMIEARPITTGGRALAATPSWLMVLSSIRALLAPSLRRTRDRGAPSTANHPVPGGPRRIVTTHDPSSAAIILSDEEFRLPAGGEGAETLLWRTGMVPADNSEPAPTTEEASIGAGFRGGSAFRVSELAPECTTPLRRKLSVDYCLVLSGELELRLDGGETVRLLPGDIVVQRGTRHAWHNPNPVSPCKFIVVMIEARPMLIGGETLPEEV